MQPAACASGCCRLGGYKNYFEIRRNKFYRSLYWMTTPLSRFNEKNAAEYGNHPLAKPES